MSMSWQGFLLLNLAGIIGTAFWLGSLVSRLSRLEEDRKAITSEIDQIRREHAEAIQRMRSAYHHVSGFLQAQAPGWEPFDIDAKR